MWCVKERKNQNLKLTIINWYLIFMAENAAPHLKYFFNECKKLSCHGRGRTLFVSNNKSTFLALNEEITGWQSLSVGRDRSTLRHLDLIMMISPPPPPWQRSLHMRVSFSQLELTGRVFPCWRLEISPRSADQRNIMTSLLLIMELITTDHNIFTF